VATQAIFKASFASGAARVCEAVWRVKLTSNVAFLCG
jgi:hypothetical protein